MSARAARVIGGLCSPRLSTISPQIWLPGITTTRRSHSTKVGPNFGLFFDIDGVISRGRTLLPHAKEAFQLLTDKHGKFWVPSIFVTNAGNVKRQKKSDQLSEWLGVEVTPDQVVMSHSPLRMFQQFMDKHVLVAGQGPTKEIAKQLGFTKVTTIETFRQCFPMLDMVDHKRRKTAPCAFEKYFPRIEAVIMFGEPVRWETNLQLIIDVLITNGLPVEAPQEIPYPHIPVLACNMDLMWMSEACMPRFAHGSFLHCLESVYKKISGHELKYTALVGKPSQITYHHSENVLQHQAYTMGLPSMSKMYCIGDNPDVDIYGANLYNRYLRKRQDKSRKKQKAVQVQKQVSTTPITYMQDGSISESTEEEEEDGEQDIMLEDGIVSEFDNGGLIGLRDCNSVLVCTGVYSSSRDYTENNKNILLNHNHRDFIMDPELKKPTLLAQNVYDAVQLIFKAEGIS